MAPATAPSPSVPATRRTSVPEHVERLRGLLAEALEDPARPRTERRRVTDSGLVGRVAAVDVEAPGPLPSFDNSQMDGFAVRAEDLRTQALSAAGESTLPLAGVVPAGAAAPELPPGGVLAVMTGAPIPEGADCVVPVERTTAGRFEQILPAPSAPGAAEDAGDASPAQITFTGLTEDDLQPGRFIRRTGSDVQAGDRVLSVGDVLTPSVLGLLAALGLPDVRIRPRARALVLSTGDEVRQPGSPLHPGQLYDADTPLLIAALESFGVDVQAASATADDVEIFTDVVWALLAEHDPQLLVTAGGISAGAFEVVRQGLASRGVEFGSVAQQPGGPQGWGLIPAQGRQPAVAVICLPGNPVSCAVSLETLVRPALAELDAACPPPHRLTVRLEEAVDSKPGVTQYRRAVFTAPEAEAAASDPEQGQPVPEVRLVGGPSSHLLGHLARADVLLELHEEDTHVEAGAEREALLLTGRTLP
ncbi:gephyrin-like molybdotransferase Glp [Nesterenkonia sp. HG001]|uniref:molybdopterin molybdotransferase MoeA n=1 Tax=Nesterenkonia sp. HG001 TaxID=2983207 RepID=UPI002AC4BEC9|nr:gephyrin-like molybdotransferase Glp [Nesterenkonia sp. HG001]MDZ5076078.1 molybdopterin molybdotransferase MoeA [Nesterenkonia sp. HG001]